MANYIDAGEYHAIGLNLGRISKEQLVALKVKLEAIKAKLQNYDFSNVTMDDLVGELLYSTALAYHAELGTLNYTAAKRLNVNAVTLPSETIFATNLKVLTLWGTPRTVQPSGLTMDADCLMQVVKAKDNNNDSVRLYMLSSGILSSALEYSVPEQFFSTPENPVEGISTVKALKIASDHRIPIYTIRQENIATTLPQLQLDPQVIEDIQNAVSTGKEVTVSKSNISFNGWNGCGYIITNPETGAGAYMISGGLNGSHTDIDDSVWGMLDTVFTALGAKNDTFKGYVATFGKKAYESVGKKLGFLSVLVSFISDLNTISAADNEYEWLLSYILISSIALLSITAMFVAAPAGIFGVVAGILFSVGLNYLKNLLLDGILNAQARARRKILAAYRTIGVLL